MEKTNELFEAMGKKASFLPPNFLTSRIFLPQKFSCRKYSQKVRFCYIIRKHKTLFENTARVRIFERGGSQPLDMVFLIAEPLQMNAAAAAATTFIRRRTHHQSSLLILFPSNLVLGPIPLPRRNPTVTIRPPPPALSNPVRESTNNKPQQYNNRF